MRNYTIGQIKYLSNQDQITHLVAQKNYTQVYFQDGSCKLLAYNLKRLEEYLSNNELFQRVHKSYIVNKNFISTISEDGERIKLLDKTVIPISNKMVYAETALV